MSMALNSKLLYRMSYFNGTVSICIFQVYTYYRYIWSFEVSICLLLLVLFLHMSDPCQKSWGTTKLGKCDNI